MTTEARPLEGLRSSSIALLGRRRIPQEAIILAITIALALTIFFFKPKFLSFYNLESVVRIASIYGIVAIGMTLVIISGGVDLSAGAVMALGGAVSAGLLGQAFGAANPVALPVYASLSLALAAGALVGAINGVLVAWIGITPFIATLGTMLMVRCVVYSTADFVVGGVPGSTITFSNPVFDWLGSGAIAGIPSSGVLLGLCAVGFAFLLKQTALGRSIIAIGANPEIARLAGINVPRILVITYSLMGMLSAFGGILLAARLSSVSPLMGIGYELDIVTIVIVGGASLSGGRGSVWGTVFAAVLIAIIDSGLNMLNVPSFVQYLVKSTILLSAVILDRAYHARTQA